MSLTNQLLCRLIASPYHCNKLFNYRTQNNAKSRDQITTTTIKQSQNVVNITSTTNGPILTNDNSMKRKNGSKIAPGPRVTRSDLAIVSKIHAASLNGLPGSFIGASQAATATSTSSSTSAATPTTSQDQTSNPITSTSSTQSPIGSSSTGTHPENNLIKPDNIPQQARPRLPSLHNQQQAQSSSEAPISPIADIAPSTSTQTSNLNAPNGQFNKPNRQQMGANNRQQQQQQQAADLQSHSGANSGQIATTNSISVQLPTSHGQQTVGSILPSATTMPTMSSSSPSSTLSSTQQTMANLPSSTTQISQSSQTTQTINRDQSQLHHSTHPNIVHNQQTNNAHKQTQFNTNRDLSNNNNMANSVFGLNQQPIRSQNSLASTKYSLDGIIATAILGGFIFLGAIITIIVIVLRR